MQQQLIEVLDVLFNVAEASVAAATATLGLPSGQQAGVAADTRDRLLNAAASVVQDCSALASSMQVGYDIFILHAFSMSPPCR